MKTGKERKENGKEREKKKAENGRWKIERQKEGGSKLGKEKGG